MNCLPFGLIVLKILAQHVVELT